VLEYGPFLKAFPIAVSIIWLVLLLWIRFTINPTPESSQGAPIVLAEFLFFVVVLPWIFFLEVFGTRAIVSPEGLQSQSIWRGTRFLKWRDVETIHHNSWLDVFVVKGHGTKITLDDGMRGLPLFAEALHSRLPPEKWAKVPGRLSLLLPKGPYD